MNNLKTSKVRLVVCGVIALVGITSFNSMAGPMPKENPSVNLKKPQKKPVVQVKPFLPRKNLPDLKFFSRDINVDSKLYNISTQSNPHRVPALPQKKASADGYCRYKLSYTFINTGLSDIRNRFHNSIEIRVGRQPARSTTLWYNGLRAGERRVVRTQILVQVRPGVVARRWDNLWITISLDHFNKVLEHTETNNRIAFRLRNGCHR